MDEKARKAEDCAISVWGYLGHELRFTEQQRSVRVVVLP